MYSPITGIGSGTAPVVNLTWPFLDRSHVKATVNGADAAISWTGANQVTFALAVPAGASWSVYRRTERNLNLVDFTNGSVLTEADLDAAQTQRLYIEQELAADSDRAAAAAEVKADAALALAMATGGATGLPLSQPRPLSFGPPKYAVRGLKEAVRYADAIHLGIVGFAAGATGGFGKTRYLVESRSMDPSVEGSFFWALAQAKANGGGMIQFDTRGHFNVYIESTQPRIDFPNVTIVAPGRNVTFWTVPLTGSFIINASNVVIANILFRTMPGTLAVFSEETGKTERKLVTVDPTSSDMVAFVGCEFRHASDGALDMNSPLITNSSPVSRITVQDFLFWDTDQPMMVGSGATDCAVGDPDIVKITLHNGVFAYNGGRQPKMLGRCRVDMSNVYTLALPFQRDQVDPAVGEFGACYGAEALSGGTLTARGCLWVSALGVTGYDALYTFADARGVDGAAEAIDSAAENMNITPANVGRITALPYTLPHDPVPPPGPAREAWIAQRWATVGARVDSAPDGNFVWTADTSRYPNGETVLIDRTLGGRWIRTDAQAEFIEQTTDTTPPTLTLPRGDTVQIVGDRITVDPDNSLITLTPESGVTDNLNTLLGGVEGRVVILHIGSGVTITLKSGGTAPGAIDIVEDIVMDRRGRTLSLIYISGSWAVLSSNERVTAAVAALLQPSIQTVVSAATVTPNFANNQVTITAQAVNLTLANPTGTSGPSNFTIRIKDNGTARTITYGTQYRAIGVTLPTTTVANKTLYLACTWNSTDSTVDVVGVAQQA